MVEWEGLSELSAASIRELKSEERGLWLIRLLVTCATHVSKGNMEQTNACLEQMSVLACATGDPMQRVASYFMEGLAARMTKSWPGLYRALSATQVPGRAAGGGFLEVCPYLKLALSAVNHAIMEAMDGQRAVHIIDLHASEPIQWVALLQALCARPGGPPHLKITGIHHNKDVLDHTARRLTEEAQALYVPFQFNPVLATLRDVDAGALRVKTGEAVAVSAVLQLHALLAGDDRSRVPAHSPPRVLDDSNAHLTLAEPFDGERAERNRMPFLAPSQIEAATRGRPSPSPLAASECESVDRFLRTLRGLSPKVVVVVVEQESNHNGATLMERFLEALHFYGAVFDSLESTLARHCPERVSLERHLFGQQINNIVACEGAERVERHEKLERWMNRFDGAGFALLPLRYTAAVHGRGILNTAYSSEAYRLVEDRGCLILCWHDRPMFSVSAWQS